jgi:hypothetical protein
MRFCDPPVIVFPKHFPEFWKILEPSDRECRPQRLDA